jgi:hypothetical protein
MNLVRRIYLILLATRSIFILLFYRNRHLILVDVDNTLITYDTKKLRKGAKLRISLGKFNLQLVKWIENRRKVNTSHTLVFIATARGYGSYKELKSLDRHLNYKAILLFGSTRYKVNMLNKYSRFCSSITLVDDLCDYDKDKRIFVPNDLQLKASINYLHPNEIL